MSTEQHNNSEWISVTNASRLSLAGISRGDVALSRLLEDMYRKEVSYLTDEGMNEEDARERVKSCMLRQGLNTCNQEVWQYCEKFALVVAARQAFVSVNNVNIMKKRYGRTEDSKTRARAVEEVYREEIQKRVSGGLSPVAARRDVERHVAAYGNQVRGGEDWAIHPREIPKLAPKLEEMRAREGQWRSVGWFYREGGTKAGTVRIFHAITHLYEWEVHEKSKVMGDKAARREVERTSIRPSQFKNRLPSFEVHESYLPKLREYIHLAMRQNKEERKCERSACKETEKVRKETEKVRKEAEKVRKEAEKVRKETESTAAASPEIRWKTLYEASVELGEAPQRVVSLLQRVIDAKMEELEDGGLDPEKIQACIQNQYTKEASGGSLRKPRLVSSVAIGEMRAMLEAEKGNPSSFRGRVQQSRISGVNHAR